MSCNQMKKLLAFIKEINSFLNVSQIETKEEVVQIDFFYFIKYELN